MKKNFIPPYPWQAGLWQQLSHDRQQLPHALLLYGRAGIGKYAFARYLSQALLCKQPVAGHPCGECASCHWFNEESHPDFRMLTPEQATEPDDESASSKKTKKKTQISVAQIRDLSEFLSLSSHRNDGARIVLIQPAEALNAASANALLKMLEEPAPGVIFILVANQLQRLLPTIISRCQKVSMPAPNESQALAWLSEQGVQNAQQQLAYVSGSPIQVMNEQAQLNTFAEIWRQFALGNKLQPHLAATMLIAHSAKTGIIALQKWLCDLMTMCLTKQVRYHIAQSGALQGLADKVNLSQLMQLQKKVDELRKLATHPLNHELQLEALLVEYTRVFVNK
ncbi:MAG TPA: DNA polymerase III subunit delta' [Methylophilaceae bacterium]|nr:DNA polymerase III subunit delta' [Methylophilaceae bacterium]